MMQKRRVRQSSVDAYYNSSKLLGKRATEILEGFCENPGFTDFMLAKELGHSDPNYVRPRRYELVAEGFLIEDGRRICLVTGLSVLCWRVTQKGLDMLQVIHAKERGEQVCLKTIK